MFCVIYKITNLVDNKCYIGQTWQPMLERFGQHKNHNDSVKLYNAMKKYGFANFIVQCITISNTQEIADYFERFFINKYKSTQRKIGYNISNGGYGVGKHSNKTKQAISKSLKGRVIGTFIDAHKANMSKSKMGHLVSQEVRNKISLANKGKVLTEEHIKKIRLGHKGLKYVIKDPKTRNLNISKGKKKKISDKQVIEIIEKWNTGKYTGPQLAIEYNTTRNYIYAITSGRSRRLVKRQ